MTTIGHNNPPDPIDTAIAPFSDAISEAENWLDGTKVTNQQQMESVDAVLKDIRAASTAIAKAEKAETAPLHDAWKKEKARWTPTVKDIDRMKKGLATLVGDFKVKLAKEQAVERAAAEREAAAKREAAAQAARKANAADIEAVRAAEAAAAEAQAATKAAKSVEKVKGLRKVHRHEITDMKAALHWIARNDKAAIEGFVTEYVRMNAKTAEIDGVRCWIEKEAF